jgi:hypothetical protein
VLAIIAGGLFVLVSLLGVWTTQSFVVRATRADGVVASLNAGSAHPQIEFAMPSGDTVSFPAGGFISYNTGERVTVLYLPEAPRESVRLNDFGDLWLPDIISGAVGVVVMLLGAVGLVRARSR